MALDFLLLQRYPDTTAPRFRHYEWHRPAFTFGYAQKIGFVREQLRASAGSAPEDFDLCRRPTGGGLVDHRDDWTYAVVIPRGHPLEEVRAAQSYRLIHEALAEALRAQGIAAQTKLTDAEPMADDDAPLNEVAAKAKSPAVAGVCFQRAEIHDVVHASSGEKIAGAAQKRNKHGLLFQGSIWRPAASGVDWERFQSDFTTHIAAALEVPPEDVPWPEFNDDEVSGLTGQYSSPEWIELR